MSNKRVKTLFDQLLALETQFKKLKEKVEKNVKELVKIGTFITLVASHLEHDPILKKGTTFRITNYDEDDTFTGQSGGLDIAVRSYCGEQAWTHSRNARKATRNEIIDFLFKEAKNKDVEVGASIDWIELGFPSNDTVVGMKVVFTEEEVLKTQSSAVLQDWNKRNKAPILVIETSCGHRLTLNQITAVYSKNKVPEIDGYKARYTVNGKVIHFGCAAIDVQLLKDVHKHMHNIPANSNRAISCITLSSGKTLTMTQIDSIVEYINKVNEDN